MNALTRQFHADGKKRRSFLTMLFAAGELRRYALYIHFIKVISK